MTAKLTFKISTEKVKSKYSRKAFVNVFMLVNHEICQKIT